MPRPQKNNAEYFSHDVSMRDHRKIRMIRSKFWNEWYAVFCMMLEVLADSEWFIIEIDEIQIELLSNDFMIDPERLKQIIQEFEKLWLMQKDWSQLLNINLIERMQPLMKKREIMRERYWKQQSSSKSTKVEGKPPGETKPKMTQEQFEQFWSKYPVKQWKKKAEEKFLKIKPELFQSIMNSIDRHAKGEKWSKWFIPMPETFINQERWNDEVPEFTSSQWNNGSNNSPWSYPKKTSEVQQWKESTQWSADLIV